MLWHCARQCGAEGSKRYPSAQDAERSHGHSTERTKRTWADAHC
ncbi:hypothetical protein GPN2_13528 [Streptomyces murinus]